MTPTTTNLSLEDRLAAVRELLRTDPTGKLWDVLTASRGPDSPSERGDMPDAEHKKAYRARRARKYKTVEVIRQRAFGSAAAGSRMHDDDKVYVPRQEKQDHFDRHVVRAANALGLKVKYED